MRRVPESYPGSIITHLADTDSEDDSIYPATAEDNGDDNTNAFDPVDVGAGDVDVGGVGIGDVAVSNIPAAPTAAYVSQLETEIEALSKGNLLLSTNFVRKKWPPLATHPPDFASISISVEYRD